MEKILEKWDDSKKKVEILEKRIAKYKAEVSKEMNKRGVEKLDVGDYSVSRRRNTRAFLSKESVPEDVWTKYSTKCSYDAFYLKKK